MRKGSPIVAALVLFVTAAALQAEQPHVVVGVRSLGEVTRDLSHVAELLLGPVGQGLAAAALERIEARHVFDAIDPERPAGVYATLTAKGGLEPPVAFIPVRSGEAARAFASSFPEVQLEKMDDALWRLAVRGRNAYVRFTDGYAFVSWTPEAVADPIDPSTLAIQQDFQIIVHVAALPRGVKVAIVDGILARGARCHGKLCRAPERCTKIRQRCREAALELIEQIDTVSIALATDRTDRKFVCEVEIEAKPGTELAERIADTGEVLSKLPILAEGAELYVQGAYVVPEECFELLRERLERAADQIAQRLQQKGHKDLSAKAVRDVLEAVCGQPTVDAALAIDYAGQKRISAIGVARVADADQLRETFERCAGKAKLTVSEDGKLQERPIYRIEHTLRHKGKERSVSVYVWFGRDYIWCAAGHEARDRLVDAVEAVRVAEPRELRGVSVRLDLRAVARAVVEHGRDGRAQRALSAMGTEPLIWQLDAHPIGHAIVLRATVDDRIAAAVAAAFLADINRDRFQRYLRTKHHRGRAGRASED